MVVLTAQLCEQTKNHGIVHFKEVNYMAWELHLHKAFVLFFYEKAAELVAVTVAVGRHEMPGRRVSTLKGF